MSISINGRKYAGSGDGTTTDLKPRQDVDLVSFPPTSLDGNGNLKVATVTLATMGTFADKSGSTSATPNTAAPIMAANANRTSWYIQNISDQLIVLLYGTVAFRVLYPGQSHYVGIADMRDVDKGIINSKCAVASASFYANDTTAGA